MDLDEKYSGIFRSDTRECVLFGGVLLNQTGLVGLGSMDESISVSFNHPRDSFQYCTSIKNIPVHSICSNK